MSLKTRAGILGMGMYLPDRILTNQDLEAMVETNNEWIVERTGIRERRIAADNQATVDLSLIAANKALAAAGIKAEDLDLIILATATPDRTVPASATMIQHRLGANKAGAFDLGAACSGFLYGLSVASQFIETGKYRYILLIGAETLSRILNWSDRNTCVIFGDGAGAAIVGAAEGDAGILAFNLRSDGGGSDLLQVPAGGSLKPATHQTLDEGLHYLQMSGNEIFKLAVRAMIASIDEALREAGVSLDAIDWVVPHQASLRILQAMTKRLPIDPGRIIITLDYHGNTSAASIPLALAEKIEQGVIKKGQLILLTGFGAGLTWGSVILRL